MPRSGDLGAWSVLYQGPVPPGPEELVQTISAFNLALQPVL